MLNEQIFLSIENSRLSASSRHGTKVKSSKRTTDYRDFNERLIHPDERQGLKHVKQIDVHMFS